MFDYSVQMLKQQNQWTFLVHHTDQIQKKVAIVGYGEELDIVKYMYVSFSEHMILNLFVVDLLYYGYFEVIIFGFLGIH